MVKDNYIFLHILFLFNNLLDIYDNGLKSNG